MSPRLMTTIRSARAIAAPWSRVTRSSVASSRQRNVASSNCSSIRWRASTSDHGSSNSRTRGRPADARAIATRRRSPGVSASGRRSSSPSSRSVRVRSAIIFARSGLESPASFKGCSIFCETVRLGYSASLWDTRAQPRCLGVTPAVSRPSMRIAPPSIPSAPQSIRISVDLPLPGGPRMTLNSPAAIVREKSGMTAVPLDHVFEFDQGDHVAKLP